MPDTLEPQLDELRRRARRRLVGAVVLALAAAVLVPMLLESDPKPLGEDVSVRIPPVDDGKFVSKLGDKAKDAPAAVPAKPAAPVVATPEPKEPAPPAPATTTSSVKPPADGPKPSADPTTTKPAPPSMAKNDAAAVVAKTAPPPPAETAKPVAANDSAKAASTAKSGAFSVQLAAFSDDKGANALAGRLKKAGHPAYTEPYTTSRGTLYRVRVGPYPTRDAAEDARSKLKAEGQSGIIAQAN